MGYWMWESQIRILFYGIKNVLFYLMNNNDCSLRTIRSGNLTYISSVWV